MPRPSDHDRVLTEHEEELLDLEIATAERLTARVAEHAALLEATTIKAWSALVGDLDQEPSEADKLAIAGHLRRVGRSEALRLSVDVDEIIADGRQAADDLARRHLRIESAE